MRIIIEVDERGTTGRAEAHAETPVPFETEAAGAAPVEETAMAEMHVAPEGTVALAPAVIEGPLGASDAGAAPFAEVLGDGESMPAAEVGEFALAAGAESAGPAAEGAPGLGPGRAPAFALPVAESDEADEGATSAGGAPEINN